MKCNGGGERGSGRGSLLGMVGGDQGRVDAEVS